MSEKSSFGSLLSGLVIGGVVGYIYGTLYAPKEGEELRNELKEKFHEKEQMAEQKIKDFIHEEEVDLVKIKDKVLDLIASLEGDVTEVKGKAQKEYGNQKDRLLNELERLEIAFNAGKDEYMGKSEKAAPEVKEKKPRRRTKAKPRKRAGDSI